MMVLVFDEADCGHWDNCEVLGCYAWTLEAEALSSTSALYD